MKPVESWTWPDVRSWLQEQPALAKYAKNELKVESVSVCQGARGRGVAAQNLLSIR